MENRNRDRLNQTRFEHTHPVTIFFNLGRVLYLIVIPLLRGLVSALRGGFENWLSGAWVDLLVLLLMLAAAAAIWFVLRFRCDDDCIEVRTGLLNRRHILIPWDNVTTLTLIEPFFLRPVRALRFRADTVGGSIKDPDFSILLSAKQADAIFAERERLAGEALGKVYQPTTKSIVALSLLTSNSFAGILFIAAVISQSGKLLGNGFSQRIIGSFEEFSRNLAFGLPPAAAALAYILIAGWFIGFSLNFIRYKDFTLTRQKDTFSINGGLFTHRKYYIKYNDVNYIDIRQSIFTKLLRLHSLYISAAGYGKQKDDISCIIPAEPEAEYEQNRKQIFPHMPPAHRTLQPARTGFMRFIGAAAAGILAIAAAMALFLYLFPSWSAFIWFVGLMTYIPAIFFLLIQIIDFKTCGLAFADGNYTIRYSAGWSLHTVVIPQDKVVSVEFRQGFFQKFGKYCDVIISTKAESRTRHCCRNLIRADLLQLFQITE